MEHKQYLLCVHCYPYKYLPTFDALKDHLLRLHCNLGSYQCGQCKKVILSKSSLIRHIQDQHVKKESQTRDASSSSDSGDSEDSHANERVLNHKDYFCCVHCTPNVYLTSVESLNNHFHNFHAGLPSLTCGKCRKNFIHKTSLVRHIEVHISKENENVGSSSSSASGSVPGNDGSDGDGGDINDDINNGNGNQEENVCEGPQAGPNQQQLDFQAEAARFLLRLRASGNMTNTSIKMIVDEVSKLLENVMLQAQQNTRTFLNATQVPPENAEDFLKGRTFNTGTMFEGLHSIDEQLEYYCQKYGLVIPEELYLGTRIENRFNRASRMFLPTQVNETFQYVSLIETLTLIVQNDFLRNLILAESQSEDGVYRSYKDGTDFANNPFLRRYPHSLRLVLYYDGLEIANALGSKDVIHALGCFYFSIQNLPPEESSLLSSIFLLALCFAADLKKPGAYRKILAKFVMELKQLQSEEGVLIDLPNGEKFVLRACLCTLTADTLAAHEIMGFFSSSGADKFCRICLISKANLIEDSTFIGTLRTSQLHKQHVREVERRPASASRYGIIGESILAQVMRVPEDSVFDVFHDMVGVCQMILKLTLYELIMVQKLFSVKTFNDNIDAFVYGDPDEKNKPSANFSRKKLSSIGHTLRQYGSQTFCLLRVFPFLIKGANENNKYLQLVFLLQEIMKIVFSFELKEADINRLQALLNQFGTQFHQIFIFPGPAAAEAQNIGREGNDQDDGDEDDGDDEEEEEEEEDSDDPDEPIPNMPNRRRKEWRSKKLIKGINKLHHIMHYPQQIREKGPIIRLWCARYEGRHRLIRKHSAVQCNFKNPPKTMARMFQLSTLEAFLERTSPHADNVSLSGAVTVSVRNSPYSALLLNEGFQEDNLIRTVESAHVCGEKYQEGLFVILKNNNSVQPEFAIIVDVLVDTSEPPRVFLLVNKCRDTTLIAKYNAYKISKQYDETTILVNVKNLANHRSIAPWNPLDKLTNMDIYLSPRTLSF